MDDAQTKPHTRIIGYERTLHLRVLLLRLACVPVAMCVRVICVCVVCCVCALHVRALCVVCVLCVRFWRGMVGVMVGGMGLQGRPSRRFRKRRSLPPTSRLTTP